MSTALDEPPATGITDPEAAAENNALLQDAFERIAGLEESRLQESRPWTPPVKKPSDLP